MIYKIEIEITKNTFWSGDRWGNNLTKVIESVYRQCGALMLHSYSTQGGFDCTSYCLKNIKKFDINKLKHSRVFVRDLKMFHDVLENNSYSLVKNDTSDFLNNFTGDLDIYLPFYIDLVDNKWIANLEDFFSYVDQNFEVRKFIRFSDKDDYLTISKSIIRDIKLNNLLK